jgi:hypothetical protein
MLDFTSTIRVRAGMASVVAQSVEAVFGPRLGPLVFKDAAAEK